MRALLILTVVYVFSQFFRAFLAVVAGDLSRDLGLGPAELGTLSGVWFGVFAVAQLPIGYALDTVGPRRTMAWPLLAAIAGAVLFALAPSYGWMVVAMALIGFGVAPLLMAGYTIFARTEPPERFALLAGLMVGFGNLGNLLSGTPLALLLEWLGWRQAMLVIAGLLALATTITIWLIRDPPPLPPRSEPTNAWRDLWAVAGMRLLWPIFVMNLCAYAVVGAYRGLWIGPYYAEAQGLDTLARGHAALLMGLGMAVGAMGGGWVERFFGAKRVVLAGVGGAAASLALLALAPALPLVAALALTTAVGLFGMVYSVVMAHGRRFLPDHLIGRGVTFMNFLAIGGVGVLQFLSGWAMERLLAAGWSAAERFALLHGGFAMLLALALVVYAGARAGPKEV